MAEELLPNAHHLGLRILREGMNNTMNGLIVLGEHPTDLTGTRLLIPLKPRKTPPLKVE